MLALVSMVMVLLLMRHCVAHLVAQAARLGGDEVVQRLDSLLLDHVQVSLLFLEGAKDRVLGGLRGCWLGLLVVDQRGHQVIVGRERCHLRVYNETVGLAICFVAEGLLVVPRVDSIKTGHIDLILVDHLNVASMRFQVDEVFIRSEVFVVIIVGARLIYFRASIPMTL